MNQASSSRLQVEIVTSSKFVRSPERNLTFFAQPRRLRGAYSHSASSIEPEREVRRNFMLGPEKLAPSRAMCAFPVAVTSSVFWR